MQGKRILLSAIGGLMAFSVAAPALAVMSLPMGWYLEGNLGGTKINNKTYPANSSHSTSGSLAWNGNLGYKFMPYFAAEAGYTRYSDIKIKNGAGNNAATETHYSYDLAFKGILPAADTGLEIFAKIGAARISDHTSIQDANAAASIGLGSSSHTSTGLYYGGGLQYYLMPELALEVQWERAHGSSNTGSMDMFGGGASFIFD